MTVFNIGDLMQLSGEAWKRVPEEYNRIVLVIYVHDCGDPVFYNTKGQLESVELHHGFDLEQDDDDYDYAQSLLYTATLIQRAKL